MENKERHILALLKEIFGTLTLTSLSENLGQYIDEKQTYNEFEYYLEEWSQSFDEAAFFEDTGIRTLSKLVHIFDHYIDLEYIFSLTKSERITSDREIKYQIILNKSNNDKIKNPILNLLVFEGDDKEERELQFELLRDKLNILGIKTI